MEISDSFIKWKIIYMNNAIYILLNMIYILNVSIKGILIIFILIHVLKKYI